MLFLLLSLTATQPPAAKSDPDYEVLLNDRMAKAVTPETNANVLLWQVFGPRPEGGRAMPPEYFKRLGVPEPPAKGDYFTDSAAFGREQLKLDPDAVVAYQTQMIEASKRPWTAAEFPRVAAWLAANEKPLATAARAAERPKYFNPLVVTRKAGEERDPLIGALLPSVQKCRELAAALCARAMLRTTQKDHQAAWADIRTAFRLGRHVGAGGTLIELLVGFAIDGITANAALSHLDRADLTAAQLRDRLADILALPPFATTAEKIDLGERHVFLDMLQIVSSGRVEVLAKGADDDNLSDERKKAMAALDWSPAFRNANRMYDRLVATAKLPTRDERLRAMGGIEIDMKALKRNAEATGFDAVLRLLGRERGNEIVKRIGDILIALMVPAVGKVLDAEDRAGQNNRNLRVAFALTVFRKENGKYPAALDALAPKYLAAVPDDLFTGKPLIYRLEGAGYVVYSVGMNGKDDGGNWLDDGPGGDDIRVRMPLRLPKQ